MASLPVVGWLIDLVMKASLAVPFWLVWTKFGIGGKFFYFLPSVYLTPNFLECVGIFIVVPIILSIFTPKFVSISNSNG